MITVRKGQAPPQLERDAFRQRFMQAFFDPAYRAESEALARLEQIAWDAYREGRKAPVTRKAGDGFADPEYELSVEWRETRDKLIAAQQAWARPETPSRVLLVCGSARNDGTCPGEISKTFRLVQLAREVLQAEGIEVDLLDLSLCHLRLRPAHPSLQGLRVHGHAAVPLALQLLSQSRRAPDRRLDERDLRDVGARPRRHPADAGVLVPGAEPAQADDGPAGLRRRRQPRSHQHARQEAAKRPKRWNSRAGTIPSTWPAALMAWWCTATWPASRACGARCATGWTGWGWWMRARRARLDRYIGYFQPYALSHEALDADIAVQEEVRNVARSVAAAVRELRAGRLSAPGPVPARPAAQVTVRTSSRSAAAAGSRRGWDA